MQVHHDLNELPVFRNAVVTIGSFDGVHSGHKRILEMVIEKAREEDGESVVVTFHPHPRQIIYPKDDSLKLLTTTDEKILLLEQLGIDHLVVAPFTVEFSQWSADEYVEKFLYGRLHPKCVVIGYDHRFGLNRQGDINYLKWYSEKLGFEVKEIEKLEVDNLAVSSTKIRNAVDQGSVETAARFMEHYFPFVGHGGARQSDRVGPGFSHGQYRNIPAPQAHPARRGVRRMGASPAKPLRGDALYRQPAYAAGQKGPEHRGQYFRFQQRYLRRSPPGGTRRARAGRPDL
ncbi:MAG: adenylyltransferase/cytidyltransferase family protein [Saprospirales bacterium]|nr:adenylyltransferase/cytidyltransferase family protein [Saprospirales bacterium]